MKSPNTLRVPSVSELLAAPSVKRLMKRVNRNAVVAGVRSVLHDVRREVQRSSAQPESSSIVELAERIARRVLLGEGAPRPVVNATGTILHRELGPPPLAEAAIEAMVAAARSYSSDGIDLAGGSAERVEEAERLLASLTGAEAAIVVGSYAAAVVLTLAALARSREVLISRGHLIETEAGERLGDWAAAAGVVLGEVGASNATRADDYAAAIGEKTAALLHVHSANFRLQGYCQAAALEELAALGAQHNLPVLDCVGPAALVDLSKFGLSELPLLSDRVEAGVDLVLADGEGPLGGPRCGLILGRVELVQKIARHPLARAVRIDKLSSAALSATLSMVRDGALAQQSIPLVQLIATPLDNLKNRAERLALQLVNNPMIALAEAVPDVTYLSSSRMPSEELPTWCVALTPKDEDPQRLAKRLFSGSPSVAGRVQGSRVYLDLRSVLPRQDADLIAALASPVGQGLA